MGHAVAAAVLGQLPSITGLAFSLCWAASCSTPCRGFSACNPFISRAIVLPGWHCCNSTVRDSSSRLRSLECLPCYQPPVLTFLLLLPPLPPPLSTQAFGALLRRGTRPSTPSTEVPSTSASSPTLPILAPVPAGTALHGVATATALLGVVSHPITLLASELEEAEAEAEAELVLESSASGAVMRPSGVTSHPIQLDTADEE